MPSRSSESTSDFLFPGQPVAEPITKSILRALRSVADDIVVVRDSQWDQLAQRLAPELDLKVRWVRRGDDFTGRIAGLAATGRRVAAFCDGHDARLFAGKFAGRPFPMAVVLHAVGAVAHDQDAYGFALASATPQESIDFALIGHRVAETALVPGCCWHTGFNDPSDVATILRPEPEFLNEWLPDPADRIPSATPAQQMLFGQDRRLIPAAVDLNRPAGIGGSSNHDASAVVRAGYAPFFLDEVPAAVDHAFEEFGSMTGRFHRPVGRSGSPDADYFVVTEGPSEALEAARFSVAADSRQRLGILRISLSRPFPDDRISQELAGCRAVTVLQCVASDGRSLADIVRVSLYGIDGRLPRIYEANGDGGRSVTVGEAAAAWTNMLPGGRGLSRFNLGIDFAPDDTRVPSLESLHQSLRRSYSGIRDLGLTGAPATAPPENSPKTLLLAASGGSQSVAEVLTTTAFEILRRPVASTAESSEAIAGSTNDVLVSIGSVSPAASRLYPVDVVVASRPDSLSSVLQDRLASEGTVYIPSKLTGRLEASTLKILAERAARVYAVDLDSELAEANILPTLVWAWLDSDPDLSDARDEFASGFREQLLAALPDLVIGEGKPNVMTWSPPTDAVSLIEAEPTAPEAVRKVATRTDTLTDASRFWKTVGFTYATDRRESLSPDPYVSSNILPAQTGSFRSRSIRLEGLPDLVQENCTGCGACAAFCPEGAIRISVQSMERIVEYGIARVKSAGVQTVQLERAAKPLAKQAHKAAIRDELQQIRTIGELLNQALEPVLEAMNPAKETREILLQGFKAMIETVGSIPLVKTDRFFYSLEKESKGSGELYLLGVDTDACTSCGLCVEACDDEALVMAKPTVERIERAGTIARSVAGLQPDVYAAEDVESADFLLGRTAAETVIGADPTLVGSGTKLTVRLICSMIASQMAGRFAALVAEADELLKSIDEEIKQVLQKAVEVNDFEEFVGRLDEIGSAALTASDLAALVSHSAAERIDSEKLGRLTRIRSRLDATKSELASGDSGSGRARLAAVFGSGEMLDRNHSFPFNPYAFPWVQAEDSSPLALAEGLFDGIMATMCSTFETFREARRLAKGLNPAESDIDLQWRDLTDEEWLACPPVCVFIQNEADLSQDWIQAQTPINLFILDRNRTLIEDGWGRRLWSLARPDWFLLHGTVARLDHFAAGIRDGVGHRGPSVFRLYAPEPAEARIRPDRILELMESAVVSRAFPLLRYEPDPDREWTDRWSLNGNDSVEDDWVIPEEATEAEKEAGRFWRLLQELAGIRSTALSKARLELQSEIDRQVSEIRQSIESDAKVEIGRVKSDHAAIYQEKLVKKLLALSGYGPGTEEYDRKLRELS